MGFNLKLEQEMKKFKAALWAVAFSAFATNAISACHAYDYGQIQLRGEVLLKAPTEIGKGAGVHRNPQETHTFLRLEEPICMSPGTNSYESAQTQQREITLYTLKGAGLAMHAGKHVSVSGILMHSFVSDAHTPLQFVVKDIVEIEP
jgi:hypothetical protein